MTFNVYDFKLRATSPPNLSRHIAFWRTFKVKTSAPNCNVGNDGNVIDEFTTMCL